MRRTFVTLLAAVAAAILFGGLVYGVLVAAHVSEPGSITVYGLTARRLWATIAAMLGLLGVVVGGLALTRRAGRAGMAPERLAIIVAFAAGLIAVINGGLNLAVATGGPGTGNGVVGGAAALVLGLIAVTLGGLGLARRRRTPLEQMT
jgi:Family of unknown function (DUF6223)